MRRTTMRADVSPSRQGSGSAGFPGNPSPRPPPEGWISASAVGAGATPAEDQRMTSSASSATWLPVAIARAENVAAERTGPGRHAEPEWSRDMYDATRDEDPFEWLGFGA
jgi:hypothetical protein